MNSTQYPKSSDVDFTPNRQADKCQSRQPPQSYELNKFASDSDVLNLSALDHLPKERVNFGVADGSISRTLQGEYSALAGFTSTGEPEMPRTPFLLRSSPAQGTGSYGALPVHELSSSAGTSDVEALGRGAIFIGEGRRRRRRSLRNVHSAERRLHQHPAVGDSEPERSDAERVRRKLIEGKDARTSDGDPGSKASNVEAGCSAAETVDQGFSDHGPTDGLGLPAFDGIPTVDVTQSQTASDSGETYSNVSEIEDTSDDERDFTRRASDSPPDDSPYSQVRASVSPTDDHTLSINTPRMWVLSMLFAVLGSSTNLFFSLRYPSVSLTPVIALLLSHPLGLLWDQIFKCENDEEETFVNGNLQAKKPRGRRSSSSSDQSTEYRTAVFGSFWRTIRVWLAQGQWNAKEHACVYISSNVSFGFAFATDVSRIPLEFVKSMLIMPIAGYRRARNVLQPENRVDLSNSVNHFNTSAGICTCWGHSPISRSAEWHDLARHFNVYRDVHNST